MWYAANIRFRKGLKLGRLAHMGYFTHLSPFVCTNVIQICTVGHRLLNF